MVYAVGSPWKQAVTSSWSSPLLSLTIPHMCFQVPVLGAHWVTSAPTPSTHTLNSSGFGFMGIYN